MHSTLKGQAGNDVLTGNGFDSHLLGGSGNDHYFVNSTSDAVVELSSQGTDTVTATIDYVLGDNLENLELTGTAHIGTGNALANQITGTAGNDELSGMAGNDRIVGGGGGDKLWGGAGKDTFVFNASELTSSGMDQIMDFTRGDKIDLRAIDAKSATLSDDSFRLIGSQNFHHVAGELQWFSHGDGVLVSGDVNGDGLADFTIMVHGVTSLGTSDLIL
jgi:Ca2+-binding RTX toxin-like protein